MTAVEWLISEMTSKGFFKETITLDKILNLEYKAEEMHKQEIVDAFDEGQEYEYQYHVNNAPKFDSQTYYQETFVSNGTCGLLKDYHIVEANEMASSQTEISDEEVEEMLFHHSNEYAYGFKDAIKWYREKLKKNL